MNKNSLLQTYRLFGPHILLYHNFPGEIKKKTEEHELRITLALPLLPKMKKALQLSKQLVFQYIMQNALSGPYSRKNGLKKKKRRKIKQDLMYLHFT